MSPACYQLHHPAASGETHDRMWVGRGGGEAPTTRVSDGCSNRLSYRPRDLLPRARRHSRRCEHCHGNASTSPAPRPCRFAASPQPCGRIDRPQPARPSFTCVENTPNARSTRMMMVAPHKGREHATKRPNHRGGLRGPMFRAAGHGAILVVRESEASMGRSCQGSDAQSIYPSPTCVSSMRGN